MLTQIEVRELINYDPTTGNITVLKKSGPRSKTVGSFAGCKTKRGTSTYLQITLKKQKFYVHRLVWLYMTGEYPNIVDHLDGNGLNNSWKNLKNGNYHDNNRNVQHIQHDKKGMLPIGVYTHRNKYIAAIKVNYKKINLGVFDRIEDADNAYKEAKKIHHKHSKELYPYPTSI